MGYNGSRAFVESGQPSGSICKMMVTGQRGKPPKECSEEQRIWIELKALANIMDVLGIDDPNEVVNSVKQAQRQNSEFYDLVNQLLQVVNEVDGKLEQTQVKINVNQTSRTALINRKVDMESTLEGILDLLKDLNLDDEELLPIIREMRKQLGAVFKEAGCNVEDEEMDYSQDSVATITYKSGRAQPLEVAIVEFFVTIEHFIDQLSGTLR
ncbi:uncharacterized protein LOC112346824 isoform X1 [Selaginella moellendorffii]|uniref:uncharacterized protein LOC112346824 isoform X1 n=1 Tax=Selaginella moellendorffii TaxID=88036 RepID=UPI000D1D06B9|nr:uncharacterized protein LOC112346824 isoform X1 [Selaginella moellendorffii]|eukprot:XP_024532351.1 uncharacterized protein LOC112346824 isoform X1 [Selaginella moellendorffii]